MKPLQLDTTYVDTIYQDRFSGWDTRIHDAHTSLMDGTGAGSDYRGWLHIPETYDRDEFARISQVAGRLRDEIDTLIIVGIGGSYLGARAVIELLSHAHHNDLRTPRIYYLGNHMGADTIMDTLEALSGREIAVNIISKSGTTTEPAIAFRILKEWMIGQYGIEKTKRRIIATTDSSRGALKQLANEQGYETFVIPDDIGGRYSVFTAVGLLPIAIAGIDITSLMSGAHHVWEQTDIYDRLISHYVAYRHTMLEAGKNIELLSNFTPSAHFLGEWWKQLFGESEGKDLTGIYPDTLDFSTDLHSLGQYVQEGKRLFFQTCIHFDQVHEQELYLPHDPADSDGLNYLIDTPIHQINTTALHATLFAHQRGGVPSMIISAHRKDAEYVGAMMYFFEKACAISGYVLGVNPFDQPGVEAYKNKMFELLGKPKK